MRLLKIIGFIFLVYFIRRFIQMYKVMAKIQREQEILRQRNPQQRASTPEKNGDVIEADFKVVDRN